MTRSRVLKGLAIFLGVWAALEFAGNQFVAGLIFAGLAIYVWVKSRD